LREGLQLWGPGRKDWIIQGLGFEGVSQIRGWIVEQKNMWVDRIDVQ
jgi:hypothetical protein